MGRRDRVGSKRLLASNGSWWNLSGNPTNIYIPRGLVGNNGAEGKVGAGGELFLGVEDGIGCIKIAVEAGELDAQIEIASVKLRSGFKK